MPADRPAQPELTVQWVKSSLSFSNGNCVEVAGLPGGQIGVRDSKDVTGPVLSFTPRGMARFPGRRAEWEV